MGRGPQNIYKVMPKPNGKLVLRDYVGTSGSQKLAGICISEMSQLFLCLKNYSFNQEACAKEILGFQTCYNRHIKLQNDPENLAMKKKKDVNRMLKMYPERMEQRMK